jgi:hypothetical protein
MFPLNITRAQIVTLEKITKGYGHDQWEMTFQPQAGVPVLNIQIFNVRYEIPPDGKERAYTKSGKLIRQEA